MGDQLFMKRKEAKCTKVKPGCCKLKNGSCRPQSEWDVCDKNWSNCDKCGSRQKYNKVDNCCIKPTLSFEAKDQKCRPIGERNSCDDNESNCNSCRTKVGWKVFNGLGDATDIKYWYDNIEWI